MALASTIDLAALHGISKKFSNDIKNGKPILPSFGPTIWPASQDARAMFNKPTPKIPSPSVFKNIFVEGTGSSIPSISACAIHLEFLAALRSIRDCVLESEDLDKVFGTQVTKKTVTRKGVEVELKDDKLMEKREVKWEKYVDLAVVRFLTWWNTIPEVIIRDGIDMPQLPNTAVPPLDVLMVWHSFLLNPRWFRRSSNDGKKMSYNVNFPWAAIHESLKADDWSFSPSDSAATTFEANTSLKSDLFEGLLAWNEYPDHVRKILISATRHSLISPDLETLEPNNSPLTKWDKELLIFCANAKEGLSVDLKNAVLRQASFVDKMWDKLWIGSPALEGTIRRACQRYSNFLALFRLYPTTMFVPTLDIDLVWHTHQCSPSTYYATTQAIAGKFVNHDDTIVQTKLDTGLKDTKSLYRMRFGKEYHICGCWDCEALLSAIEETGGKGDLGPVASRVGADVAYYRALEVARRKKEPVSIG